MTLAFRLIFRLEKSEAPFKKGLLLKIFDKYQFSKKHHHL